MSDQNRPQALGEPQAVRDEEALEVVKEIGSGVLVCIGSMITIAVMITPARAKGATCSGKVNWQERQRQIEQVLASGRSTEQKISDTPASETRSAPEKP